MSRFRSLPLVLLVLSPLGFVLGRVYEMRSRELPVSTSVSDIGAYDYDPQIIAPVRPWQTVSVPPNEGEVCVCAGGECANVKARSGDQLLIGGTDYSIAEVTVNGARVNTEERGYDLVVTVP